MDVESIREEIREKLETANNHIDRYNVNQPYKNILEQEILLNPKNVAAYCLLGIVFFEMNDDDRAVATLEKCYEENKNTFSDNEYFIWATCTAYFIFDDYSYVEEHIEDKYNHEVKKALNLLEEAVRRKSNFYQTYYALGWYYFENKLLEKASEAFHTAYLMSKDRKYLYCKASCLLKASKSDEGLEILESLYRYPFVEEEEELDFSIALSLGFTLTLMGETERASEIAEILLNKKYPDFYCGDWQLTDFLYTLGYFEYVINFYDNNKYAEDASWRSGYFYSFKMLGKNEEADLKLNSIIKKIEGEIRQGEIDDDWETDEDKKDYIKRRNESLDEIKKCYTDVFANNIKPPHGAYYDIIYECYYIGCPRHYHQN